MSGPIGHTHDSDCSIASLNYGGRKLREGKRDRREEGREKAKKENGSYIVDVLVVI